MRTQRLAMETALAVSVLLLTPGAIYAQKARNRFPAAPPPGPAIRVAPQINTSPYRSFYYNAYPGFYSPYYFQPYYMPPVYSYSPYYNPYFANPYLLNPYFVNPYFVSPYAANPYLAPSPLFYNPYY